MFSASGLSGKRVEEIHRVTGSLSHSAFAPDGRKGSREVGAFTIPRSPWLEGDPCPLLLPFPLSMSKCASRPGSMQTTSPPLQSACPALPSRTFVDSGGYLSPHSWNLLPVNCPSSKEYLTYCINVSRPTHMICCLLIYQFIFYLLAQ